jgi:hypothetical protein
VVLLSGLRRGERCEEIGRGRDEFKRRGRAMESRVKKFREREIE